MEPPKNESADEETRVDHCTALGDVASRSASRYPHNNGHLNRHNNGHLKRDNNAHLKRHNNQHLNRRYLRRGNGCDVLQRTHRPEHEWLWIEQRDRVECCVRIEQRERVEGRVRSSGGAGSNTSSIPTCPDFPPANELCN